MPADLFIGLVTHPRSRFPEARTPDGLAGQLAAAARVLGWAVETATVDDDLFTDGLLAIDHREVSASIDAELNTEARWREYVAGAPLSASQRAVLLARKARRKAKFAPPWRRKLGPTDPGPKMVRRLANIELAHMSILRQAARSGARWALLLEDDAQSDDPKKLARELKEFAEAAEQSGEPRTINLSESFTVEQLGIGHLLTPKANPGQPQGLATLSAQRIVTNTVCAVLYGRDYLEALVSEMEAIPLSPVIPIDFKVNEAVMRINGRFPEGTCWVASPAPIEQGSGVPNVSA